LRSEGPTAERARLEFGEILDRKGHAVDNARDALERLVLAFDDGSLVRTPEIDEALADLRLALEQDAGQKLGGKSAEAARFITRRIRRLIEDA
jgi:hypothetical protein